jgi:two-component system, NtrC family, nitrogen regulation sensor histidine kinase NtrY
MRITFLTVLTFVFFGSAFLFEYYYKDNKALEQYAVLIQKNLQQNETDIQLLAQQLLTENARPDAATALGFLQRQPLAEKKYSLFLYQGDSLLFWNNNKVLTVPDSADAVRCLDNGYYYVKKITLKEDLSLLAAIPIKYAYQIDANNGQEYFYLENNFAADKDIATFLSMSTNGKGVPIYNIDGKKNCEISFFQEKKLGHTGQYQLLILFTLAFLCLAFLVNSLSLQLLESKNSRLGVFFFVVAIVLIKWLSISLNLNQRLGNVTFFLSSLEPKTISNTSPGAMLVNISLLLWSIIFYYKHINPIEASGQSRLVKTLLSIVLYTSIVLGLLMTVQTHNTIVTAPDLSFDFDNFFYINITSTMTILSILLIWFALFLLNYKITKNILMFGFTRRQRALIFGGILIALAGLLQYVNSFEQPTLGIILFCAIYVLLLDVFSEGKDGSRFTWLIGWLMFFGITSTVLLYSYHRSVDFKNLEEAVNKLAFEKDNNVIRDLDDILHHVESNIDWIQDRNALDKAINQIIKRKGYLLDHYRLTLSDTTVYADKTLARALLSDDSLGNYNYDVRLPILVNGERKHYRLEAVQKDDNLALSYQEPLFKIPYLKIKELSNMSYSIFKNNVLIKAHGQHYLRDLSTVDLASFTSSRKISNRYSTQYMLKTNDGKVIVGYIPYGGLPKMISLFTYLLVFLFGISLLMVTINTFTNFIDDFFVLSLRGSLQTKVQQTIVGLIIFSCIFIGAISIIYFTNIFENNNNNYVFEKLNSVQSNIANDLGRTNESKESLIKLIAPISNTHQIDINLYDLSGKLLNPEGKNVFQKGIQNDLMNTEAYQALVPPGNYTQILEEKIGTFKYQTAYGKIIKNQKTIAYFGLPFYKKEWERENALSDTIGHLLSFYVLLIMAVVIFSYLVASVLLRPLKEIGAKLKLVKLGQKRLDVDWKGSDALGDLIREFNIMLGNLKKQAQAGEQSARDEAWQQMAKQVAHDIRNTLTPMKLSIQFLEHSSHTPDLSPEIGDRIRRISATIVEQISHFNQIANKFGDFAKAQTEPTAIEAVNLNDFVSLNCELFKNNLESQTVVNVHLPQDAFFVKIDRAQMARVVTNLITNAQQAIPENREGRIDIYLFEQDDNAVIRVSDNGLGIPSEELEQIFQPNFTTKKTGTGLGLAICRKLVQDVEGTIYCTSTQHQGSDFYVELPIIEKTVFQASEDDETIDA